MEYMRGANIPQYIINCFSLSGFDDIHAIIELDNDKCLKLIETYIEKKKKDVQDCFPPGQCHLSETPFEFAPGH